MMARFPLSLILFKSPKGGCSDDSFVCGVIRCVHGGASASMMDAAIGVCVNKCFTHCVTATLSMNYKR